jgi:sigma-B regulation protein RsbU (phosphoserine phosphatase)
VLPGEAKAGDRAVTTPVVYQYQQALDEFRREGREPPLLKRMSELISLLDLTTTLGSSLTGGEILDAALLIVMGELQVSRGALWVAEEGGGFRLRGSRGLPGSAPQVVSRDGAVSAPFEPAADDPLRADAGIVLACPVRRAGRTIALLGLGPRAGGAGFGREEIGFLESLAACAAVPIENGLIYEELRQVNRSLTVKVFQLHNLFDIGRELTGALDEGAIERLVATTVMGQFLASRCALWRRDEDGEMRLSHARGLRPEEAPPTLPPEVAAVTGPMAVGALPEGEVRGALASARFALVVPLASGGRTSGLLAVGEKPAGLPFAEEDVDFAAALARQAQAALEGARLHRMRLEKERQDRELQIAREIQQSLFPRGVPRIEGFDLAAVSRSCYQVGGDYFDFIPLDGGRLAVVVADVSGKGTPASIMMASVHASLQAMAGTAPPAQLLVRLNRFLYENTQTSRYVTLFYGELDPQRRTLAYVNAGHIPPIVRRRSGGACERLRLGGPVIGLLEEVDLEPGEVVFEPGDVMAVVTDGATEAVSPDGEEFTDARVLLALSSAATESAAGTLQALLSAVDQWTGAAGCTDDITVLTLRAT